MYTASQLSNDELEILIEQDKEYYRIAAILEESEESERYNSWLEQVNWPDDWRE